MSRQEKKCRCSCRTRHKALIALVLPVSLLTSNAVFAYRMSLNLGAEKLVQANSVDIQVPGHSVPSFVDWNNDGLGDLLIGEGGRDHSARVRVYLSVGTESEPRFSDYFYVQVRGSDRSWPGSADVGCFPRVVLWDGDARKDLLVGLADGTVKILLNTGTDSNPVFSGEKGILAWWDMYQLDVGEQATPALVDWDNDGRKDLISGGQDGKIHVYLNCGCGGAIPPSFFTSWPTGVLVRENGQDLVVPSLCSSPVVLDLDRDGKKDLITGNAEGQILFYRNVGTDSDPNFSGYLFIEANGVAIDLPGSPRSRPFVCDWTGDGYLDLLIGAADGKVHLYQSIPQPGDIDKDYDVDLFDFAVLASVWRIRSGDHIWNPVCDLSNPSDDVINVIDLDIFAASWLEGTQ